jgi:FLVCR family MFS transporter
MPLDTTAAVAVVAAFLALSWLIPVLICLPNCFKPPRTRGTVSAAQLGAADSSISEVALLQPQPPVGVEVSSMRFWALLIYCLGSFMQNVVWIQFSTIVPQTVAFYGVSTNDVNFLVVLGGIFYIPCSFAVTPLIERFGLRAVTIANNLLIFLAVAVRLLAHGPHTFYWIVIGQSLNAAAGPAIGNIFTLLSATWFPPHERTTASAVGLGSQGLGCGAGWLIGGWVMRAPADMPTLLWLEAGMGLAFLLLSLSFPGPPATAPSLSAASTKTSFWAGNLQLLKNKSFVLLALVSSGTMAIVVTWGTLIDEFLDADFSISQVGAIGTSLNLAGMVGGVAFATVVDRLGVPLKSMLIGLLALEALTVCAFLVAVYLPGFFGGSPQHVPYWPVFGSCIAQGIVAAGTGPLFYELAAEITYPVGEETSATFLAVLGNFFYILAMQLIGDRVSSKIFNWVTIATLFGAAALMVLVRGKGGRSAVDAKGHSNST